MGADLAEAGLPLASTFSLSQNHAGGPPGQAARRRALPRRPCPDGPVRVRRDLRPVARPAGGLRRGRRRLGPVREGADRQHYRRLDPVSRLRAPAASERVIEEHFYFTYITDTFGIHVRHEIGVDRSCGRATSRTRARLAQLGADDPRLVGVPAERDLILAGNARGSTASATERPLPRLEERFRDWRKARPRPKGRGPCPKSPQPAAVAARAWMTWMPWRRMARWNQPADTPTAVAVTTHDDSEWAQT